LVGIFKQKNPANIVLLLVFGVLIKLPMFTQPHITERGTGDGILFRALLDYLHRQQQFGPVIYPVLAFFLLFIQAIILSRFIAQHRMMNRPTYLPGMAYMLITSLFQEWNYFTAPLLVNTFLLFVLSALFHIYNQAESRGTIFNIGLALGLASFFYFPAITFIFWILLALMVMRPFRLNEWVLCLLGVTAPFYFYAVYLFITGGLNWNNLLPPLSIHLPSLEQSAWMAGSVFLLTVPFLIGSYYVQDNLRKMLIQVRKGWSLVLLYLLVAILVPFVNNSDSFANWVMAAVPFAAFHGCTYLYSGFRIVPVLFFWITVAFVIGFQYWGPGW
jgi:hypothetical protein